MPLSPFAGNLPTYKELISLPSLIASYYTDKPDCSIASQKVGFGTSGHRGTSLNKSFNEDHILAMTQAVCEVRKKNEITGPLFIGMDSHALSEPAFRTALEVLIANEVTVMVQEGGGFTPTPVISHAILTWNKVNSAKADGIVITPSHNPPSDGGFKYNPPNGGPADTDITSLIENRANELLQVQNSGVKRCSLESAKASKFFKHLDMRLNYIKDLSSVLDMKSIADAKIKIGADPMNGSSVSYFEPIAEMYNLNLSLVNKEADPSFRNIPRDHDGKIRMDCSSPYAMSKLLELRDNFDLAFGCDPDADRHGIVTKDGLMNPNHYLSVVVWHLFQNRPNWSANAGIGKTVVTTSMLNNVAKDLGRKVYEVPVGFKWFVPYLFSGECGLGCEESAGASFLRFDATPWSTDKDGPLLCLLSAEIMAKHGKSPSEIYRELTNKFGAPAYARVDSALEPEKRAKFKGLSANALGTDELAGSKITDVLTNAPANDASIGGVKVCTNDGWFAARPSGTEAIYKLYTESFLGEEHRQKIESQAISILAEALK